MLFKDLSLFNRNLKSLYLFFKLFAYIICYDKITLFFYIFLRSFFYISLNGIREQEDKKKMNCYLKSYYMFMSC